MQYILKAKQRALYIKSDTTFFNMNASRYIIYEVYRGLSEASLSIVTPNNFYGDGTTHASGIATYPGTGSQVLTPQQTVITFTADTTYTTYNFRLMGIGGADVNHFIQNLVYGALYTLPTNIVYDRTVTNEYKKYTNFTELGKPVGNGFFGPGYKRKMTLVFDYITRENVLDLKEVFKAGRGGLPYLYIEDTNDTNTWVYCTIPNMSIEEPYPCYYSVSMNLEEI